MADDPKKSPHSKQAGAKEASRQPARTKQQEQDAGKPMAQQQADQNRPDANKTR